MSSTGGSPEGFGRVSASASEKHASTPTSAASSSAQAAIPSPRAAPVSAPQKPRSCVVCRRRKVRCDKSSPCSNCRSANIPCVYPSTDRPPRWARRLERLASHAEPTAPTASTHAGGPRAPHGLGTDSVASTQVMERLRTLEGLVRELSGQLEQANANVGGSRPASAVGSPGSSASVPERDRPIRGASSSRGTAGVPKDVGRLFVRDANAATSRYVSSGFWSRINDELDGLKTDLGGDNDDISEDEDSPENTASTSQFDRTPSERHAFLFRYNSGSNVPFNDFHPLPSQVPYILNIFSENVNIFLQIVHIPTLSKQIKAVRGGDLSTLPICTQALMFSIYFAAVTSMEDDDVMVNFGTSKSELSLKYRLGLEHALAQADFLNNPDLALVQAFTIFLGLVRRHDSPRYVWMMTGLAIRMAQALGLHRDGSHFPHLTPFEVEMRRRAWCAICALDLRASEDQGTDVTIARSSFDTSFPLNINDTDIDVDTKDTPTERPGIADSTIAILMYRISDTSRKMVSPGMKLEDQDQLLKEMSEIFDRGYLQHSTEPGNMAAWVGTLCIRLVVAKMTLLVYLPRLFTSPNGRFSDEIRNKLLVAAIEVAEHNHSLNAEEGGRQWRWIYQTYTHWYAIVYLLIEIIRRPLSPIVERAWLALHSRWLIPTNHKMNYTSQVWVPLRRMMTKARQHRESELERLRGDVHAVRELEEADRDVPVPGSSGPFTTTTAGKSEERCLEYWRRLVTRTQEASSDLAQSSERWEQPRQPLSVSATPAPGPQQQQQQQQQGQQSVSLYPDPNSWPGTSFGSTTTMPPPPPSGLPNMQGLPSPAHPTTVTSRQQTEPTLLNDWVHAQAPSTGLDQAAPWLWTDMEPAGHGYSAALDMNMDLDGDIDWMTWMESAKSLDSM